MNHMEVVISIGKSGNCDLIYNVQELTLYEHSQLDSQHIAVW